MKKKDKVKVLISLLILCVILIFLVILCSYLKKQNEIKKLKEEDEKILAEQVEKYTSDKTCPRGMATLYSNYNGKRSLNDLYRNLNVFVEYLPKISKQIYETDEAEVNKLYNENKSEINEILGVEEEEFSKLVNYLKEYDLNNKKFNYCEIDSSTYENTTEYLIFNMSFYYENITDPIILKIYFSNNKNSNKDVIYSAVQ